MNTHITSIGLVEVKGFISAVEVADAMIKSSEVRIYTYLKLNPGLITIVVEGDLGACESAVDAGARVATNRGTLVSVLVKGKPDAAIESLLRKMLPVSAVAHVKSVRSTVPVVPVAPVLVTENDLTMQSCLNFLAAEPNGKSVAEIKKQFKASTSDVYAILKMLEHDCKVERDKRRYRLLIQSH